MSRKLSNLPVGKKDIPGFVNIFPGKIMCVGRTGRIVYANNSMLKMLEYQTQNGLKGHPVAEIVEDKEPLCSLMIAWQNCNPVPETLLVIRTKNGDLKETMIESNPFLGHSAKYAVNLCYIRDVTKLRRTERKNAELLKKTEAALVEAEEANKSKDTFFTMMSHELRTPLTAILGWARLISEGRLDQESTDKALETIQRNAKLQAALIDDLLDMAKILSSKCVLQTSVIDLAPIIAEVIDDLHHSIEQKQLTLEVATSDNGVHLLVADENKLRQVIQNLLSNAVKFTRDGGTITIGTERIRGMDQDLVAITVQDDGIGIKKEFLSHVFERFKQQEDSISRIHGGLGLGLAIAKHIVEAHHGSISVHSDGEGTGATFTVQLPLLPEEDKNSLLYAIPPAPAVDSTDLEGLEVLVVEDDNETRVMLCSMLKVHGVVVQSASGTDEALEILESWTPDLILSDIGMPEKSGYVFMELLQERGNKVPAIALTAFVEELDRNKALEKGFIDHIPKPIDMDLLLAKIRRFAHFPKPASVGQ